MILKSATEHLVHPVDLTNGIDYAVYPQPKGYQVGIQVSF